MAMIYFSDTLDTLNEILSQKEAVYAICDVNVKSIGEALGRSKGGKKIPVKYVTVSEKEKDLKLVSDICGWLLDKGADRNALVLAIGGGITTDVVGFAASIYKRGVKAAYVPTTLLAQVDAAIGGKTGVNFKKYKNMLGTIVEPEFTFICSACLKTLPEATFRQGLAELLKAFLIENNNDNYRKAIDYFSGITSSIQYQDSTVLLPYIQSAVKVKERIVGEDLYESGLRRVLNLAIPLRTGLSICPKSGIGSISRPPFPTAMRLRWVLCWQPACPTRSDCAPNPWTKGCGMISCLADSGWTAPILPKRF